MCNGAGVDKTTDETAICERGVWWNFYTLTAKQKTAAPNRQQSAGKLFQNFHTEKPPGSEFISEGIQVFAPGVSFQ